ncbi:hypothetical protein ZWY2020_017339 [Hordeum vulgare]|nr:hypothetical protein ZWY2020_017339 [Hordeum vulgare]
MAHMRKYTRALCFVALVAMTTTSFLGNHFFDLCIGTTDVCLDVENCSPPDRASGNTACKACCVAQGYDKDKSGCMPGSSSTCYCAKN